MGRKHTSQERAMRRVSAAGAGPQGDLQGRTDATKDEAVLQVRNANPPAVRNLHTSFHLRLVDNGESVVVRDRSIELGYLYPEGDQWVREHTRVTCVFDNHGTHPDEDFTVRVTGYPR